MILNIGRVLMLYSNDYYLLLQEFANHPVKGTLCLIGFGVVLYLLYLLDKRIEERKESYKQKVNRHE